MTNPTSTFDWRKQPAQLDTKELRKNSNRHRTPAETTTSPYYRLVAKTGLRDYSGAKK